MQGEPRAALARPLAAWAVSLAGVGLAGAGLTLPGSALAALALLPWIALAGMPRDASRAAAGPLARALAWPCLALPPCALAAALDARAGRTGLAALLAGGLLLVLLSALAAAAAGRARAYGWLWLAWVPGAAALLVALRFAPLAGGEAAPAPAWLAWLARAHPLAWAWQPAQPAAPWPVVAAALLWLAARESARRAARSARP